MVEWMCVCVCARVVCHAEKSDCPLFHEITIALEQCKHHKIHTFRSTPPLKYENYNVIQYDYRIMSVRMHFNTVIDTVRVCVYVRSLLTLPKMSEKKKNTELHFV